MTTDKRAAAIAALRKAREAHRQFAALLAAHARPDQDDDLVIGDALHKALAALEADDGRALLIELRKWVWRNIDPADGMNKILAEIDRLLSAPEQPAPEPAAPHADDKARIAEWTRKAMANAVHFENERVRYPGYHLRCSQVDEAVALMLEFAARPKVVTRHKVTQTGEHFCQTQCEERKSLAAGKAKAEANLHAAHVAFGKIDNALGGHGWTSIDDVVARAQGVKPRNEQYRRMDAKHVADLNNDIADLRAKLAEAEAAASNSLSLMRAKEAECAMATQRAEKAEGEAKALRAERDAARTDLANINSALAEAEPMRQHGSACERIRDLNGARQTAVTIAAQYAIERDAALRAALRAAKPEPAAEPEPKVVIDGLPAGTLDTVGTWDGETLRMRFTPAEPVPAAADAKPGDARRSLVQEDHNMWTPDLGMALINAIDGLDERLRALEVRP